MAEISDSMSAATTSNPFLGRPVEICIVTPDLKHTLEGLVKLGIGPFKIFTFGHDNVQGRTYFGKPADFTISVAFAEQRDMIWEVMSPVSGPSIMRDYLDATNGKGGIHHVSFDCADGHPAGGFRGQLKGQAARLEAQRRRREFEARGFALAQSGLWRGKQGTCEFMYFDTEGAIGTCFESYVFSDDWEEPDDGEVYPSEARGS